MLDSLITSKTRLKVLLKFFSNAHTEGYLRSLADEFGESTNAVRLELNRLTEAGFLQSRQSGKTVTYRANVNHPLFPEIKSIISKYLGLDHLIDQVILKLGDLKAAWVVGDYAEGKDSGIIDLVMVGDIDRNYLNKLVEKAEALINRKIRPLVLSASDLPLYETTLNLNKSILLFSTLTEGK